MRNKSKKVLSLLAAITLLGSTVVMSSCGGDYYKAEPLSGYTSTEDAAVSNGGFAVQKGDYVYFINGKEENTAKNEYGEVTKGALMRIKAADLNAGNYATAETVVPMLFVAQYLNAGIYIFGDYVYYATPTTDKDVKTGEIANTHIDFKRAKLDGSETMKNYYYRLSSNSAKYRFVKGDNGVVYLLFEEDGALKSHNTETGDTTVLVSGSGITYYYDMENLDNPNVYYTMDVTYNVDTDKPSTASYNQIYCVNAATTATVNAGEASYTVNVYNKAEGKYKTYRTYDFDKSFMEDENAEAKKTAKENKTDYKAVYDFDDYATYPYVNLGTLVVDGIGSKCDWTQYNNATEQETAERGELQGYTYVISRYENGGVYYTRAEVAPNTDLYYHSDATRDHAINANKNPQKVTSKASEISATTLLLDVEGTTHTYLYVSGNSIYKVKTENGAETERIEITNKASGATLWKTDGNILYYTTKGTNSVTNENLNGMQLNSIDYTGAEEDYWNGLIGAELADRKYEPLTVKYVDMAGSDVWYMPEIFGNTLMYANAQAFGSTSYYYVSATDLSKVEANNENYEAVFENIQSYTTNTDLQEAMEYYFRTGDTAAFDAAFEKELYTEYEKEEFDKFVEEFKGETPKFYKESTLISLVGKQTSADTELINEGLLTLIESETVTEDVTEGGLKGWHIALIAVGGALVVAAAVVVPVVIVKKKRAKKAEEEATVNAYKRKKIDTTDDKSIDVYADDEAAEETVEEATETQEEVPAEDAPAEETAEEEATAEAPVEAPAEEAEEKQK